MRQARSILLIVWIAAIAARSQTTDGLIAGRIVDAQTGQPIAATQVSYLNLQTNTRGVADAGSSGFYALPLLPPGAYRIRATADGYQAQEVHELELSVAGRVDLNLKLRPLGDVWEQGRYRSVFFPDSEAVLTFFGPDVDASRVGTFEATEGNQAALESTVSQVIDPAQIRELPFSGRDTYTMLVTQPGVTADTTTGRGLGLSINGQRPSASNFMLDGLENNNYLITGPLSALAPEAVQEYRVSMSNFSAEYGRTSGYLANAVTRSGSSEWHGIGYFNLKNDALNANDFQSNRQGLPRSPLKESQGGFHVGGPLRRNSLFVSGAFEVLRSRGRGQATDFKVPAPGFAESFTAPDSLARRLLTEFPTPATDPGDGITSNLSARSPISIDRYLTLTRADWVSPSGVHRLMGRLAVARVSRPDFIWYPYEDFISPLKQPTLSLALSHVSVVGPALTNELRFGWSRDDLRWDRARRDIPSLGIIATLQGPGDTPEDTLRPTLLPGSPAFYGFRNHTRNWQLNDNLLWVSGRHLLKLGGGFLGRAIDGELTAGRDGRYLFDDIFTFSFDQPRFFSVAVSREDLPAVTLPQYERDYSYNQYYLFLQDTFKVTPRLVLNLGLRYENFGAPTNTGAIKDGVVELGSGSDFPERLAATAAVFTAGGDQQIFGPDNNNFAARFGFSYDLLGDFKTVVRGGYGIFFDRPFDNLWQNVRGNNFILANFPYKPSGSQAGSEDGYLAPVTSVLPAYQGTDFSMDFPRLTLLEPSLRSGYAQNYFFGVQRELTRDWTIEINTLGSLGRSLVTTDFVNRQFSLPFSAESPQGRFNSELPDISYRANQGLSNYHALTVVARYRARYGALQAAYTWSHAIDNQSDPLLGDFFDLSFAGAGAAETTSSVASFARQFDSGADRGNADFDQRHNLVFFSNWDLPELFSSSTAAMVFRDWQFAQVAAFRTGFPYTAFAASRAAFGQGQIINQRADIVDPNLTRISESSPVPGGVVLLNEEGFAVPDRGLLGNSGRNAFRGPGLFSIDVSLSRSVALSRLGESGQLTFRADIFNLFNHANLNDPNSGLGSSTFGHALFGRRGRDTGFPALRPLDETARQIQLIVRLTF